MKEENNAPRSLSKGKGNAASTCNTNVSPSKQNRKKYIHLHQFYSRIDTRAFTIFHLRWIAGHGSERETMTLARTLRLRKLEDTHSQHTVRRKERRLRTETSSKEWGRRRADNRRRQARGHRKARELQHQVSYVQQNKKKRYPTYISSSGEFTSKGYRRPKSTAARAMNLPANIHS